MVLKCPKWQNVISLNYCYSLKVMSISTVSLQQHPYLHRECSYVDSWISGLKCEANHILKVVLKKINKTKNKLDEEKIKILKYPSLSNFDTIISAVIFTPLMNSHKC